MTSRLTKKRNVTKSQVKVSNAKHHLTKKHINRKSQTRKTNLYKVRKGDKAKKTVQKGGLVCDKPKRGLLKKLFGKKNKNDTYIPMKEECFKSNLLEMLNTRKLIMLKLLNNRKKNLENKNEKSNVENDELQEIIKKLSNLDNLYIHPYDDLIYRLYFKIPIEDECYKTTDSKKININPYKHIVTLLNLESYEKMSRMTRTFKNFIEEYQFLVEYENDKKMKDKIKEQLNSLEFYNDDYCYKPKNENQVSSSSKTVVLSTPPLPFSPSPQRVLPLHKTPKPPVLPLQTNLFTHDSKDITHIWFTDWPDHGVPKDETKVINGKEVLIEGMELFHSFITYVYEDMKKKGGNTVIHCSAGVGRTGVVYIILKLLSKQLKSSTVLDKIDELIINARQYRNLHFVQSKEQYIFIYSYIIKYVIQSTLKLNEMLDNVKFIDKLITRFAKLNDPNNVLSKASGASQTKCVLTDHKQEETIIDRKNKNRYVNIIPCEKSRVILKPPYTEVNTDYINASNMEPLKINSNKIEIIAAQCPKPQTIPDFYRMLKDNSITRIIMVTGLVELGQPKCADYFGSTLEKKGEIQNLKEPKYILDKLILKETQTYPHIWGEIRVISNLLPPALPKK